MEQREKNVKGYKNPKEKKKRYKRKKDTLLSQGGGRQKETDLGERGGVHE